MAAATTPVPVNAGRPVTKSTVPAKAAVKGGAKPPTVFSPEPGSTGTGQTQGKPATEPIPADFFQKRTKLPPVKVGGFNKPLPKPPKVFAPELAVGKAGVPKPAPAGAPTYATKEEATLALNKAIARLGDVLDLVACARFVDKMVEKLKRLPNQGEVEKTARVFVKKRQKK
ncbi:MAG: hypothetical protein ACTSU5_01650 [Promethearchaeota archaeon]